MFMKVFNEFVTATKPKFDVPIKDLGTLYRGTGVNENIELDNYSRMFPDPGYVNNHNRMNPPGVAFTYLSSIPLKKANQIE